MPYAEYTLRAPDLSTFKDDLRAVLEANDIDPEERGIIRVDEDGNERFGQGIDVVEAGRWHIDDPQYDDEGNVTSEGTKGDYALVNIRTDDPEMQALIKGFTAFDASKQPFEIAGSEKVGGGSHRVDADTISSPERVWAKV